MTLAPPKGGSNRPFQLQLCNVDARNPKAEPEVHTLAFEALVRVRANPNPNPNPTPTPNQVHVGSVLGVACPGCTAGHDEP